MTVEIIFNDKTIQIFGLKKIDIKTLKTLFNFDEKIFVINVVINNMIITLNTQTIIVNDSDNYKIFLLGEDSLLDEYFTKNKIVDINKKVYSVFLENDGKVITVDNIKVLNSGSLKKIFNNIDNLIINICIYKENQIIKVKVIGHRFELNDTYISVIGELL